VRIESNGRDAYVDFSVVRVGDSNTTGRLLTTPTALVGLGSTGKSPWQKRWLAKDRRKRNLVSTVGQPGRQWETSWGGRWKGNKGYILSL